MTSDTAPTAVRTPGVTRLRFVDGLRAVCAVYVVLHHAWMTVWPVSAGGEGPSGTLAVLTGWLFYSRFAVATFILLSGFSLALPAVADGRLRGGPLRFYGRRVQRILPPFYLAVGLSIGIALLFAGRQPSAMWGNASRLSSDAILANLLLLSDVWHIRSLNPAFWSIAVECKIYLLFPLLVWMWRRMGVFSTSAVAAIGSVGIAFELLGSGLEGLTLHFVAIFCLGTCAAKVVTQRQPLSQGQARSLIAIAATSLTLVLIGTQSRPQAWLANKIVADCLFTLGVMPLLIWMSRRPDITLARLLSGRAIVAVGGFSYSLYLTHMPLQQLIWQQCVAPLHCGAAAKFAVLAGVGTPVLCGAAYLFFLLCERPFIPGRVIRPHTVPTVSKSILSPAAPSNDFSVPG